MSVFLIQRCSSTRVLLYHSISAPGTARKIYEVARCVRYCCDPSESALGGTVAHPMACLLQAFQFMRAISCRSSTRSRSEAPPVHDSTSYHRMDSLGLPGSSFVYCGMSCMYSYRKVCQACDHRPYPCPAAAGLSSVQLRIRCQTKVIRVGSHAR